MKVALLTAVYGAYDKVKPVPLTLGVPAYLYTDSLATADDAHDAGWTPMVVPHSVCTLNGKPSITEPMLSHKYVKTHPELFTAGAEVSIWVDGSMEITEPDFVEKTLERLGGDDWSLMKHPERTCIYTEADLTASLRWRYDPSSVKAQAAHYSSFHPHNWGLVATGFMARRHTAATLKVGHHWWEEILTWSHQDQLSLPVLFRLFEEELRWNMDLPWHEWWRMMPHG